MKLCAVPAVRINSAVSIAEKNDIEMETIQSNLYRFFMDRDRERNGKSLDFIRDFAV